jgi:hypothetical protein
MFMTTGTEVARSDDRQLAIRELETRFAMAVRQRELLEQYIKDRLNPGKHFYTVGDEPGRKPSLTKEGAELICLPHALKARYQWLSGPENPPLDDAPYQITIKCELEATGKFAGEGIGSASSMVTKKTGERVQRQKDPGLRHNATIKMASKCLGSTTPIVIKTKHGISRTTVGKLWLFARTPADTIFVPSPDGWVRLLALIRLGKRPVKAIRLADGQRILATSEHRFPTEGGLKAVSDLQPGDVLLRYPIEMGSNNGVLPHAAWASGLFIAEGGRTTNTRGHGDYAKFSLHQKERPFMERIVELAHALGSPVTKPVMKKNSQGMTVSVSGPAFAGLIDQYVTGETSHNKHFNTSCWRQGPRFVEELVGGYLDGDGSKETRHGRSKNTYKLGFSGENRELVADLRTACAVLGYRISLRARHVDYQGGRRRAFLGWISKGAPAYNGKGLNVIESIDENSPATVYDMQVDSHDHLFLLASGIATHNSAYIAATLNSTAASEFFTQDLEDDQSGETETSGARKHWCSKHQAVFFKKGKMTRYAHPVKDAQGKQVSGEDGHALWCNEENEAKAEARKDTLSGAPAPAPATPPPAEPPPGPEQPPLQPPVTTSTAPLEAERKVTEKEVAALKAKMDKGQADLVAVGAYCNKTNNWKINSFQDLRKWQYDDLLAAIGKGLK